MSAVTKAAPSETAVANYSASLIDVIAQAARDPSVDIDKMERLIAMQERVQSREAETAYYAALAEMQPNLPVIDERGGIKNRDGVVQSTYALWEDVNEALRPVLAEHGFSLTFKVERSESEISVTGILAHRGGHREQTRLGLPSDTSGSKNAVQAVGSSASYGKRYTAYALLNITTTGEDDDGNKAGAKHPISVKQYDELQIKMAEKDVDETAFVKFLRGQKKIASDDLRDLPAGNLEYALSSIDRKAAK